MGGVTTDERIARAALTYACEPAHSGVGVLVAQWGAVETLRRLQSPDAGALGLPTIREAPVSEAARCLDRLHSTGGRFITPGDSEWPTQLDDLGDEAPWGLWVRGEANMRLAALRSVSIVGARASTDYGARVASSLASDLDEAGWSVVSGGAYGIDAAAHRGALARGGSTVVVLASGIDVAYPAAHEALFERCAQSGVIVSEAPPGEVARRWRFLDRNRLIAALTRGTVGVEAAHRSGALSTARCAADLGREVMGVPGPVTSIASAGVHALLRSGARLVTSAADVIESVVTEHDAPRVAHAQTLALSDLDEAARQTLAVLSVRRAATTERIATARGCPLPEVLADLVLLEMQMLVVRSRAGWKLAPDAHAMMRRHGAGT